jgi:two-component system cell cycle sensor histidine kinase/response regulator CckA
MSDKATSQQREIASLRARVAELEARQSTPLLRFRQMADTIELIAVMLDERGHIDYCNPSLLALTRHRREAVEGQCWFDIFIPEELREQVRDVHAHTMQVGEFLASYENEIITATGERLLIRWHNTAFRDQDGRTLGTASLGEDITQRRNTEVQLQEREQMLATILRTVPAGIAMVDHKRVLRWTNQAFADLLGYSDPAQLEGRPSSELYFESGEYRRVGDHKYQRIEREGVGAVETRLRTLDGHPVDVLVQSSRVDATEPTRGTLFSALDISPLKEAHETIIRQHGQYLTILEAIPELLFVVDPNDYTLLFVNRRVRDVLGYDPTGQHCHEALHGVAAPCASCCNEQTGRRQPREAHNQKLERDYLITDQRIPWPDGREVRLEIAIDITERKRLERQVLRTQRMEAIGKLAAGIAHDFNNLLQAGIGFAELAKGSLEESHPAFELLDELLDELDRGAGMTRQLLAVGRRQPLKLGRLDLGQLVGDLMRMLRRILGEQIELSHRLRSTHPGLLVNADRSQLEQVMLNICINARDAMENGGQLTVTTDSVELDEAFCQDHAWARVGPFIRLIISDTGRGMDPETRARVFEPSFDGDKKTGNGGLGLAMVFGIVQRHSGLIDVQSTPGQGTTFTIYLPRAEHSIEARAVSPRLAKMPGGDETILLAEDEPLVRRATSAILKRAGYRVVVTCDGAEAIEQFLANPGEIQLALLDVVMPKVSGPDVMRAIRKHGSDIPIIFCTGYSRERLDEKIAGELPVVITKPFDARTLLSGVRRVLDEPRDS